VNKILIAMGSVITALIVANAVLTVSVYRLRLEIIKLEAQVTALDGSTAVALQKFERDFIARQDAVTRAQQAVLEQAAKKQAAEINADVKSLPPGGVHKTLNIGTQITDHH
jgi:predicted Holliday junction resolvase-like endonuclease